MLFAALGPDATGREAVQVVSQGLSWGMVVFAGDAPRQCRWDLAQGFLEKRGWQVRLEEFIATEVGELVARKRVVMLAAGPGATKGALPSLAELELRHPIAPAWGPVMVPARDVPDKEWVDVSRWIVDPALKVRDRRLLPHGAGHAWVDGRRTLVYSTSGPLSTIPSWLPRGRVEQGA